MLISLSLDRLFFFVLFGLLFITVLCDGGSDDSVDDALANDGVFNLQFEYPSGADSVELNKLSGWNIPTVPMNQIAMGPPTLWIDPLANLSTSSTRYLAFAIIRNETEDDLNQNVIWLQTDMSLGESQSKGTLLLNTTSPIYDYDLQQYDGSIWNGFPFNETLFDVWLEVWLQTDALMQFLNSHPPNDTMVPEWRTISNLMYTWTMSGYGQDSGTIDNSAGTLIRAPVEFYAIGNLNGTSDSNATNVANSTNNPNSTSTASASSTGVTTSQNSANQGFGGIDCVRGVIYGVLASSFAFLFGFHI